jgi:hypothetical protein
MFKSLVEMTMDGSWQTLAAAGLEASFIALNIEALPTNSDNISLRYSNGGVIRILEPGDQDTFDQHSGEVAVDSGFQVNGTAPDKVHFEPVYFASPPG